MDKKLLLFLLIIVASVLCSCAKEKSDELVDADNNFSIVINDNIEDANAADVADVVENNDVVEDDADKVKSKLDGLKYDKELLDNRPIVVSLDNHPNARWQAGIGAAEIVYEVEAEFPYTRYLAVFQTKEPELIGPVRSARPYMIYIALGYDSLFTHVGGSDEAFAKLKLLSVADIDGLFTSRLWRYNETGKYVPHNVYTDVASIREEADAKGYRTEAEYNGFSFNDTDTDLQSTKSAEKIKLIYNRENTTDYKFDEESKLYIRFKDGINHIDENDDSQITAKNIIIYTVDKKVLDDEGRLYLGVIGQGTGYYITNGKYIEITWKKATENSETVFYYNNEELKLNPGNTWIQVVNKNTELIFSD